jgi:hypothetical protein
VLFVESSMRNVRPQVETRSQERRESSRPGKIPIIPALQTAI